MRVGWLADDAGAQGGAEFTQAEFRAAAPAGVEIVDCPAGQVVEGLDRYVIHNCVKYTLQDLRALEGKPTTKYWHDVGPWLQLGVATWLHANTTAAICCSPIQAEHMKGLGKAALEAAGEIDGLRESMRKIPNMLETKVKVTIDQVDFAGQAVGNAAKNKAFNPTGDGLGNAVKAAAAEETRARARSDKSFAGMIADGIGALIPGLGAVTGKVGSLMGASGALKPFAALGAQYGLHDGRHSRA